MSNLHLCLAKQSRQKFIAVFFAFVCFGSCLISGTAAATEFPPCCSSFGNDFRDTCPPGEFLVGVNGRSGDWIDQISITCAPVSGSGTTGTQDNGPRRGGNGGGPYTKSCFPDETITGTSLMMTDDQKHVRLLIFNCKSTTTTSRHNLDVGNNSPFFPGIWQMCPIGEAVIGIQGRSDAYVNAIGMICGAIPGPTPKPQPPDASCPGVASDPVPSGWSSMLNAHNERRKLHCVKPLIWSNDLAEAAQAYASECKIGVHDGTTSDGENLADAWAFDSNGPVLPALSDKDAFEQTWYCEVANYDFNNPVFNGGFTTGCKDVNGHFTQIVWKDTCALGCGRETCTIKDDAGVDHLGTHWVCRYRPRGNVNADNPAVLKQEVHAPNECQ
jgi:hypothetical protein